LIAAPQPDNVLGIRDTSGLDVRDVMYSLTPQNEGGVESGFIGVLFGAWSADPPEIELAFGTWSGSLTGFDVEEESWSA